MRHINTLEEFSAVFDIEPSTHPVELVRHDQLVVNNKFIIRPDQPIELVGEPWPSTFTQPVATVELFEWFADLSTDVFRAEIKHGAYGVAVTVLDLGFIPEGFFKDDTDQAIAVEAQEELHNRIYKNGVGTVLSDDNWAFSRHSVIGKRISVVVPFDVIDIRKFMAPRSDTNFGVRLKTITVNHIPPDMPVSHDDKGFAIRTIESVDGRPDSHVGVFIDVEDQWSPDLEQWVLAGEFRISSTGDEDYDHPWFISGRVLMFMEDLTFNLWCDDTRIKVVNDSLDWVVGDEVNAVAGRRLRGQLGRELLAERFGLDVGMETEALRFQDWEREIR